MIKRNIVYPFTTTFIDYPDNESLALLVFITGCERDCKGCHNPEFRDFDYKSNNIKIVDVDECMKLIEKACEKHKTNKIVLTGGDPLFIMNIDFIKDLLEKLKDNYKTVIYTAYDIDYIKAIGIKYFEYVKTGEYLPELKQTGYKNDDEFVLASKNQSIYDNKYKLLSKDGILKFKK